ncbi:MAG: TonB-dependent receptor [Gemmatimonadota bacterium]|nr:TonB-dependent receptor [Gemmatimonadota bacterium]
MTSRILVLSVALFLGIATPLAAEGSATKDSVAVSSLDAVVTDSLNQAVSGVEIISPDGRFKATTNSVGAFKLSGIPSGSATFVVRKIGYGAGEFTLTMNPGETLHQTIVLTRLNNVLKPVVVEETQLHQGLREVGFYERAGGFSRGTFLTPEVLASRGTSRSSDYLLGVNGVRISSGSRGGAPLGTGGYMSISQRGRVASSGPCVMNVYIDGNRVNVSSDGAGAGTDAGNGATLDDLISANDIGAIEVYPSGVTAPQKYTGVSQGCGTVLVWSKMKLNAPQTGSSAGH